jgi:hypothetical protein
MNKAGRVLVLLWIGVVSLWAREPTSQDYDVWNAIITSHTRLGTAYVWHLVEPTSMFDRGETKSAPDLFPEVRPVEKAWDISAAELDFDKFRFATKRTSQRFTIPYTIKLLDQATLNRVAGKTPKSTWLMSPRLLPGADAIFRLSWPAYREDGRAAYVICAVCTEWWGSIIMCKVDKAYPSGEWRIGETFRRTFTDWKDGKKFIDDWP